MTFSEQNFVYLDGNSFLTRNLLQSFFLKILVTEESPLDSLTFRVSVKLHPFDFDSTLDFQSTQLQLLSLRRLYLNLDLHFNFEIKIIPLQPY